MSKEIVKSAEILEKEALIKALQTKLKKRKSILKGLKTRLENTKNQITDIQRSGSGKIISKMSEMESLRLELLELMQELEKIKGLSRADKAALKQMKQEFDNEAMFGEEFQEYKAQMDDIDPADFENQFDENQRAKMRDVFEAFAVKPDKKEQKDIRKIFISLSQKFHPDKASTKADEAEYHEMMQKINEAYQAGDIQTLLELEQLFLSENLDLTKVQSFSVDVLQQEIDRLERDLQFIENQIDRNSQELKSLRASDMGQMLTDLTRADKYGMGMDAAFAQLDRSIKQLSKVRDVFKECIKVGNTAPLEELMMAENAGKTAQEEMMMMLNDMMNGDISPEDLADMFGMANDDFGDDFGNDFAPENAKFTEGMSVKIAKNVVDKDYGIPLGNLQGRIIDVYHGPDLEILYEVGLDSISLNKLPTDFVKKLVSWSEDFQDFELKESQLKKCKPRDTEDDARSAYRKLFHKFNWSFLDKDSSKRLQTILLHDATLLDWENWRLFLNKNLNFPITAQSRGMIEFNKGEKLKILNLAGFNEDVGLIVDVSYRNRPGNYPLFDLMPSGKHKDLLQIFDDYLHWAEDTYDINIF